MGREFIKGQDYTLANNERTRTQETQHHTKFQYKYVWAFLESWVEPDLKANSDLYVIMKEGILIRLLREPRVSVVHPFRLLHVVFRFDGRAKDDSLSPFSFF